MAYSNECFPFIEDSGQPRFTGHVVTAPVIGKRFVACTGRQSGPGLNTSTGGGNYTVTPAGAGVKGFGVAAYDAAIGDKVPVIAAPGTVLPVTAGATVTAGSEVEIDSVGRVVNQSAGKAVGLCLVGATVGTDAEIKLF